MIRTYDSTLFIAKEELPERKVRLYITEGLKWEDDNETEVIYTGLVRWSIVDGIDALELEEEIDWNEIDENREYLVLEFNDGTKKIFRNSHVSMFIR